LPTPGVSGGGSNPDASGAGAESAPVPPDKLVVPVLGTVRSQGAVWHGGGKVPKKMKIIFRPIEGFPVRANWPMNPTVFPQINSARDGRPLSPWEKSKMRTIGSSEVFGS
jgi:hypothetical protein